MGVKDITEKMLEDYNDVFADIVNTLLFDGKEIIKPEQLENAKDKSQIKADDGKLHEQERDVSKYWKNGKIKIAMWGLENQTTIDKDMPLRVISYDGASYKSQILGKDTCRYPVITLVLYFGTTEWDKPLNLHGCFDIPRELKPFVNDYKINFFPIAFLPEEKVKMFKSDFGIIADFFVQKRKNKEYIPSDKQIKYYDAFLKLMEALTGDSLYGQIELKGGITTMCDVIRGVLEKGKLEGKLEGRIESLYFDNNKTPEEISAIVECPLEYVNEVIKNSNL